MKSILFLICLSLTGALFVRTYAQTAVQPAKNAGQTPSVAMLTHETKPANHLYNGKYTGECLQRVAFPIGGMGAGMFCLEGTGAISHMSVHHQPEMYNEPQLFAAISIKGKPGSARVLEGPVPGWKKFGQLGTGLGAVGTTYGLARFREAEFLARFPFGEITLHDKEIPLEVHITGWSPFIPSDADNSSLPVGGLEYRFRNTGTQSVDYVFSYNSVNFMALPTVNPNTGAPLGNPPNRIKPIRGGYVLSQDSSAGAPEKKGDFAIFTDEPDVVVDHCWFRGGWWDPVSITWKHIENCQTQPVAAVDSSAPGASLFVSFTLKPGEEKKINLLMAWFVPDSRLRYGRAMTRKSDSAVRDASVDLPSRYHKPWYSSKFKDIGEVAGFWRENYNALRNKSMLFRDAFYRSTLPPEALEAVAANLTTLKSTTVMRQYDGRFWGWEGSNDDKGSCTGSCTHVWNYAQALCHLFPAMERSIRETEFHEDMDSAGHQNYRAALPIRPVAHNYYEPAADGQLGGIMKVYREWRISGDSAWLRRLYPKVKISLDYCIRTWDPNHQGTVTEPHHNTYDIEFWGADGMITSMYLGALDAMVKMGTFLGEQTALYQELYDRGRPVMENELYNGSYFTQKIQWTGLKAKDPVKFAKAIMDAGGGAEYSPEAEELLTKEGPKYQYGTGCLSDGVLGTWIARTCGLPTPVDEKKIQSHLMAVYTNNLKRDLTDFSNPQRPGFAIGQEGGLLLCTWPKGGALSLPFVYSNEVWTGIEYQVGSHLIFTGKVNEGLEIVRNCRNRYDGTVRNPFDEYECGHWYARAMSSYALLEALTGVRYDAVDKTLYVDSKIGDFTTFLSTATGFGTVSYKNGKASLNTVYGKIEVKKVEYSKNESFTIANH